MQFKKYMFAPVLAGSVLALEDPTVVTSIIYVTTTSFSPSQLASMSSAKKASVSAYSRLRSSTKSVAHNSTLESVVAQTASNSSYSAGALPIVIASEAKAGGNFAASGAALCVVGGFVLGLL